MILAAGLTPAWQQILTFSRLNLGEVNRAATVTACASGKVLNVGCALHHFGASSRTLCPVGGLTGQQIQADFATLGVPTTWIPTTTATRVCTTLRDLSTGQTTELVENSLPLLTAELDEYAGQFLEAARHADLIVLSGSLPQGTSPDYYARLLDGLRVPVLLDARGPELRHCLPLKPWLVKPNREELAATVGRPLLSDHDVTGAMRELQQAGARNVVVSQGGDAVWSLVESGEVECFPVPTVSVVNPIGCGDCLAAGLACATVEGRAWSDAVRFGIAVAAENARHLLPARFPRSEQ